MIYNNNWWVDHSDTEYIRDKLTTMLDMSDFTVLEQVDHKFVPFGFTSLFLLSESHLALHTFPEENKTYIELSSCNEMKQEQFVDLMDVWLQVLKNGERFEDPKK